MTETKLPFSSNTHIGVLQAGGAVALTPTHTLYQRYGVDAMIRLHRDDFALLPPAQTAFVHFNLGSTLNKAGERYVLLPIVKQGQRLPTGQEILPVVDPAQFRLGRCISVQQHVAIDDVTADDFAQSLPTIRTQAALAGALLARYSPMFPHMAGPELLAHGCAITRLTLLAAEIP